MTSRLILSIFILAVLLAGSAALAGEGLVPQPSQLENEFQKVRYQFALANSVGAEQGIVMAAVDEFENESSEKVPGQKSPTKAMLMSLAVPGAGQFYYGSKIKSFIFFGAEIAAWSMHIKWHADGVDIQDQFEAFNRAHWSRTAYEDEYLMYVYGVNDDDSVTGAPEISHHLPDVRTQQYYEMTGKYDQFSWGWDDAERNDSVLSDFNSAGTTQDLRVLGGVTTPQSAHRELYEEMRNDSNVKYDHARKMIIVLLVNHLASAAEAYIGTRRHNQKAGESESGFGRFDVKAQMRSYYEPNDTPYLNLAYKF